MADEMLTISKQELVDILKQAGFSENIIKTSVSSGELKKVLQDIMEYIRVIKQNSDCYFNEYTRMQKDKYDLRNLIYMCENILKE